MRVRVRLGTVRPELEEQSEGEVGFGRKRKPAECNRIARRPPEAGPHPLCECRFGPTPTVSDRGGLKTGGQGGRGSRGPGLSEGGAECRIRGPQVFNSRASPHQKRLASFFSAFVLQEIGGRAARMQLGAPNHQPQGGGAGGGKAMARHGLEMAPK